MTTGPMMDLDDHLLVELDLIDARCVILFGGWVVVHAEQC